MARVVVHDNGPGMPAEDAARVFERFYRVDPARGRAHGGTGLGLSIVSAIVFAHGGTVSAESAPGHGMTVTVSLPVVPEDVEAEGAGAGGVDAEVLEADRADAEVADAEVADAEVADAAHADATTAAQKGTA
jgi:two-component system OmpR family sensor kinase